MAAVYDRWHTRKPRKDPGTGKPVKACRRCGTAAAPYPSAEHGKGDRWQVRWRDQDNTQCKLNRPKKGGRRDESDPDVYAEALAAKIENDLNTDTYVAPRAGKITLEEWVKQWRAALTGDPITLRNLDDRLAHICDAEPREGQRKSRRAEGTSIIGKKAMADLAKRPLLVQQWVRTLRDKRLSPQYIRHIVATLSQVFIVAVDNGIVARNPVDSPTVKPPKVPPRVVQPWTLRQVQAAAEHLGNAMPYLGAGAGLRQGEIFGIADEDVKFLDGVIEVRRQVRKVDGVLCFCPPKRDKIRDVPLSEELAERLQAQIQSSPPIEVTLPWGDADGDLVTVELLFVRPDGEPHHRQGFSYTWHAARTAAGAAPTRANGMHVLRHTFAAACLANGVDVRTLADWLGHADPGFTLRVYGHLMPSAEARGRKAIDAFFRDRGQSAPNVPSEG